MSNSAVNSAAAREAYEVRSPELSGGAAAHAERHLRQGMLYGVLAYVWWGLIPLYFKTVRNVPPLELLAHRVVWSGLLLALVITLTRRWQPFWQAVTNRRILLPLVVTTALIAVNWLVYIYAVLNGNVLQASLGYFITPLANVLLGVAFLHESMRRLQVVAIGVAAAGVVMLAGLAGEFPWISLGLAASFSLYGLFRKQIAVDGLLGLFIETQVLLPLALAWLTWLGIRGESSFHLGDPVTASLLMLGGVVTAVPLLAFAAAARRLRLATLGFLQYLAPTLQFLLAVLAFGEPFSKWQIASFGCIWIAIILYTLDSLGPYWRARAILGDAVPPPTIDTPTADAVDGLE